MKIKLLATALAASLIVATQAQAHHSFSAEFDAEKKITKRGIVTKIDWTNPHTYIFMEVPGAKGVENWAFEMGSPNGLMRRGWTKDTLGIGTEVIIQGSQARDGSLKGNAQSVIIAETCQRMFAASSQREFVEDEKAKVEGCVKK